MSINTGSRENRVALSLNNPPRRVFAFSITTDAACCLSAWGASLLCMLYVIPRLTTTLKAPVVVVVLLCVSAFFAQIRLRLVRLFMCATALLPPLNSESLLNITRFSRSDTMFAPRVCCRARVISFFVLHFCCANRAKNIINNISRGLSLSLSALSAVRGKGTYKTKEKSAQHSRRAHHTQKKKLV